MKKAFFLSSIFSIGIVTSSLREVRGKLEGATRREIANQTSDEFWVKQGEYLDRTRQKLIFINGKEVLVPRSLKIPLENRTPIRPLDFPVIIPPSQGGHPRTITILPDGTLLITTEDHDEDHDLHRDE